MRLYVIPLLIQQLNKTEKEIELYSKQLDIISDKLIESAEYYRKKRDYWQAAKQEILEAINKLEL